MLNKISIPEETLEFVDSVKPEATKAAIAQALREARELSNLDNRNEQHRNFSITGDGVRNHRRQYVCTGANPNTSPEIARAAEGGVFGFVVPGETDPDRYPGRAYYIKYRYDDADKNSLGKKWLRFVMDRDRSPWRAVLRNVVDLDADRCYVDRCVLFQHLDTVPFDLQQLFMMAARWPQENDKGLKLWDRLVTDGIDPCVAFVAGCHFLEYKKDYYTQKPYLLQHEALTHTFTIFDHFIKGAYYSHCAPLIAGGRVIHGRRSRSADGFSAGFIPEPSCKLDAKMSPIGYKMERAKAQLPSKMVRDEDPYSPSSSEVVEYKSIHDWCKLADPTTEANTVKLADPATEVIKAKKIAFRVISDDAINPGDDYQHNMWDDDYEIED